MATDKEIEAAALGIMNAVRQRVGLPQLAWDSEFFTPLDKECALQQARAALTASEQVRARELSITRDAAIELAAKKIYETKGDRLGKKYIGWDKEPDEVKDDWRVDVRATIDAYEAVRQL